MALAVVVAVGFALLTAPEIPDPLGRGSTAPGFSLSELTGERVSLAGLRGRVVLLNFWATWCKPCEEEMPAMQRLHQRFESEGLTLVAISMDEGADVVRSFRERLGLTFPILMDPEREVAALYQAFRFPESLLVDRRGVVVERYVGAKPWDSPAYVERIRRLLARDT